MPASPQTTTFDNTSDPLKFDFLMDTGTNKTSGEELRKEAEKSIKYFLASLTVPEDDLWVNLSPYEKDRIIPDAFGKTAMGRDLLAEDYILKQLASSLMYPENALGKEFWAKIYEAAARELGATEIDVNNFNRVWIVPADAQVWEHDGKVVILKSHLKVMLEEDYLASEKSGQSKASMDPRLTKIFRDILVPALEKEVNEGANFARLRQVYAAMILSAWYKIRLKESLLGKAYADKNKVTGVEFGDGVGKEDIYSRYLEAARKGVFNYIREESNSATGETIPRKYFSGGFIGKSVGKLVLAAILTGAVALLPLNARAEVQSNAQPVGNTVLVAAGAVEVGKDVDPILRNEERSAKVGRFVEALRNRHPERWPFYSDVWYLERELDFNIEQYVAYKNELIPTLRNLHYPYGTGWLLQGGNDDIYTQLGEKGLDVLGASWYERRSTTERFFVWSFGLLGALMGGSLVSIAVSYMRRISRLRKLLATEGVTGVVNLLNSYEAAGKYPEFNAVSDFLHSIGEGDGDFIYRRTADSTSSAGHYENLQQTEWGGTGDWVFDEVTITKGIWIKERRSDAAMSSLESDVVGWRNKDAAMGTSSRDLGGIDLDSRKLDLQIKRDGNGVPLSVDQQDWSKINIQGFIPVIYSIEPVNMPMSFGLNDAATDVKGESEQT